MVPALFVYHAFIIVGSMEGVSNLWNGLWNGLMEWTDGMEY